ncbi:tRNA pseudouridine(38-40) synthase TruA [Variovorax sp. WS11]|uniref:tRNA pseudouridine(38-40) synthase TruA n=1 Tax=Variovorax sp. WS11 TaxID=1105204 RepID=UPI000D0DEB84|nr:tRNA pseudouridine(38-40) synthase TruA [Variovorax sp. WS11]NDZ12516.1 tRNA pseudouridine(38-40) synthase TruA [Variovorax sp. WS11]PSL85240.1 tRNA pseudouridine(38-40) synthase TruA [Variovorax sp. WS11]
MRLALGVRYHGQAYDGWQSQTSGRTVQDKLEDALGRFADQPISTLCAGRTDAGVHALMQVVHFDTSVEREPFSWMRGTNRYLPADIAVQWAQPVPDQFHCRASALTRRYLYVLSQSPVRPSLDAGRVGWSIHPLDGDAMRAAAGMLLGRHDFSSFRASACQALSPVKDLRRIEITRRGENDRCRWHFEFEADAFLHHMIRNIMGCLVRIGHGKAPPEWMQEVLEARSRLVAAPTFSPNGLYFLGPLYDAGWGLPPEASLQAGGAAYDGPP